MQSTSLLIPSNKKSAQSDYLGYKTRLYIKKHYCVLLLYQILLNINENIYHMSGLVFGAPCLGRPTV